MQPATHHRTLASRSPASARFRATPTTVIALEDDFETRRTAWIAEGHAQDQRLRRNLIVVASVMLPGAAILYAFFR